MKQFNKNKLPVFRTGVGKSVGVLRNAEVNQRLLDITAHTDAKEGIRQGLEDAEQGKLRQANKFFEEFETEHGIPH